MIPQDSKKKKKKKKKKKEKEKGKKNQRIHGMQMAASADGYLPTYLPTPYCIWFTRYDL